MSEHKVVKKKIIKKKLFKNPIVAAGLISIFTVAAIFSGAYLYWNLQEIDNPFICALKDAPNSIDPLKNPTPKPENLMIIDQVAEGLFDYDRNNSATPIIPNLALGDNWSLDGLNYTCYLRKNVFFHDGMPFNATAVKWNFDRILRFIDIMPGQDIWVWRYLFFNPYGIKYLNRTDVIDNYTIRFILNQPYAPFKELLVLWNSYILSPASTPEDQFINIETGKLVGTGPFILDSCELDYKSESIKTELHANPDYWGGKPSIEKISFVVIPNEIERMEKMISGEFSYAWGDVDNEIIENYKNSPNIEVVLKPSKGIWFVPMNNNLINATMRKAISYAFNYTKYIEVVMEGLTERLKSPFPRIMRYSKELDMPYYNISKARQVLKNANWPGTINLTANSNISLGNEWELLAKSINPLSTHNFSVVQTVEKHQITANIMKNCLEQIGVRLNIINMSGAEWNIKMGAGELEMFRIGWNIAFLDPVEIVNPLFSNGTDGEGNYFHFNDSLIQQWMEEALGEYNESAREKLYLDIQQRLIKLNPIIWLDSTIAYDIWNSKVKGMQYEGAPLKFLLKHVYIS